MNETQTFLFNVRALRVAQGLTQEDLAREIGIHEKSVTRLEGQIGNPMANMDAKVMFRMANYFGRTIDEMTRNPVEMALDRK